jgi:D-2-hydroxyglutarate dehydrogenase
MVLRPQSTEEVSSILNYCNTHNIKVVPQGGNTGLVGGGVPLHKEVILSMKSMNQIHSLDDNGILQCDAGCILQQLQQYARERGYLVPTDIGSKGSCVIGGNLSTNAGGQYFSRFGSLHANVLGLQVVLASGDVLHLLNTNMKDNTGYDIKHLFIGAEGTLGVITKVVLKCPTLPSSRHAVLVACQEYAHVVETLYLAKSLLGEILAAFEYMDQPVLDLVGKDKTIPLVTSQGANYPYCVLIETQGSSEEHDASKMDQFLETAMERNLVVDGIVAQDLQQVHNLWSIREHCGVAVSANGRPYKYDISLPISQFASVLANLRERLSNACPQALLVNWGHVNDGNLHVNVLIPGKFDRDENLLNLLEPYLIDVVVGHGGSISAEHGLGQDKNKYLAKVKDPLVVQTMKSVKALFDPKGILNPGKYFPNDV